MRAPKEPSSTTPPATAIGECVHVDIIFLDDKSIGGNNLIVVAVDESSTEVIGIPSKSKKDADMKKVGLTLLAMFNAEGHKVQTQVLGIVPGFVGSQSEVDTIETLRKEV
jgi:hypothetical protein